MGTFWGLGCGRGGLLWEWTGIPKTYSDRAEPSRLADRYVLTHTRRERRREECSLEYPCSPPGGGLALYPSLFTMLEIDPLRLSPCTAGRSQTIPTFPILWTVWSCSVPAVCPCSVAGLRSCGWASGVRSCCAPGWVVCFPCG